jgi:hypothetical protein
MTAAAGVEKTRDELAAEYLLGAFMQDAAATMAVCVDAGVTPRDVQAADLQALLAAVWRLFERGETVNSGTLLFELSGAHPTVDLRYLAELEMGPAASGAARWAREIKQAAARRSRIAALQAALAREHAGTDADAAASVAWAELLQRLTEQTPTGKSPLLPLQWARDLGEVAEVPPQLVEGVLTVGGLSSVNGQPNAGKSYIAGHLALCVAAGTPWLGRRVAPDAWALYVAAEGAASVRARWQADRRHFGHELGRIALVARGLSMLDPSPDVDALIATAREVSRQSGGGPGLIVVDTVARVMVGGDENTAVDMGRLIGAADRLRETTGAHVMLLHHLGKDAARGARGHSSLKAALDTEIEVTVDEATKTHYAKVTKQRDLPSKGETFACKFIPVELGTDQWGNPITACAVEASEVGIGKPAPRRMTASQGAVLAFLAGREEGARRAAIVEALEPQGVARSAVYKAVADLLMAGLLMDVAGVIYAPKG